MTRTNMYVFRAFYTLIQSLQGQKPCSFTYICDAVFFTFIFAFLLSPPIPSGPELSAPCFVRRRPRPPPGPCPSKLSIRSAPCPECRPCCRLTTCLAPYLFGSSSVWMLPWHLEPNIPEVAFLLLLPRAALPRSVCLKLEMSGFGFFLSCCPYVGRKSLPWCSNCPVFPSYACFCFSSERFSPPFLSTLPRRAPCLQSPPVTVWPANYTRMNLPESLSFSKSPILGRDSVLVKPSFSKQIEFIFN